MSWAVSIADAIDAFTRAIGKVATALLILLVALIGWNVLGRYVGGGASVGMQELEWHLLVPIVLIGMTVLMRENGHVRVDMFYSRMSLRTRHILDLLSMLCGVVMAILMIKYSIGFVDSSWSIGEGSPDPGGLPARYILKAMIPVGFALFALQCLANALRHAAALAGVSMKDAA